MNHDTAIVYILWGVAFTVWIGWALASSARPIISRALARRSNARQRRDNAWTARMRQISDDIAAGGVYDQDYGWTGKRKGEQR